MFTLLIICGIFLLEKTISLEQKPSSFTILGYIYNIKELFEILYRIISYTVNQRSMDSFCNTRWNFTPFCFNQAMKFHCTHINYLESQYVIVCLIILKFIRNIFLIVFHFYRKIQCTVKPSIQNPVYCRNQNQY